MIVDVVNLLSIPVRRRWQPRPQLPWPPGLEAGGPATCDAHRAGDHSLRLSSWKMRRPAGLPHGDAVEVQARPAPRLGIRPTSRAMPPPASEYRGFPPDRYRSTGTAHGRRLVKSTSRHRGPAQDGNAAGSCNQATGTRRGEVACCRLPRRCGTRGHRVRSHKARRTRMSITSITAIPPMPIPPANNTQMAYPSDGRSNPIRRRGTRPSGAASTAGESRWIALRSTNSPIR